MPPLSWGRGGGRLTSNRIAVTCNLQGNGKRGKIKNKMITNTFPLPPKSQGTRSQGEMRADSNSRKQRAKWTFISNPAKPVSGPR